MKTLLRVLLPLAAMVLLCASALAQGPSLAAERLLCEHREGPEGIGSTTPRLMWRLKGLCPGERALMQSAYQVQAARSPEQLSAERDLLWDSAPVRSESNWADYAGAPLASRDRVWWRVRVADQAGRTGPWSEPARFSIGLMAQSDWQGEWIGLDEPAPPPLTVEVRDELRKLPWIRLSGGPTRQERTGAFRHEFELEAGEIKEAWIAGTADMIGSVSVNGAKVGELARWESVRPIDVKGALHPGKNAIEVLVQQHDGFNPAVTGMVVIRYADGRERRVKTESAWRVRELGKDSGAWGAVEVAEGQPWGTSRNTEHFMPPAPYMRKAFGVESGREVRRATLYATALGVYACFLNGQRIGDAEMAPGWTEYTRRVEHQTYDVTSLVKPGQNCLGAVVGDGWWAGLMGYTGKRRFYGGPQGAAQFLGQLEIDYVDGTRQVISSDRTWRASFGPIRHSDNYMGGEWDSRLEMPGWDRAGFDDRAWRPVQTDLAKPTTRRVADVANNVRAALAEAGGGGRAGGFDVGPKVLGDPAFGVKKTLKVDYAVDGTPLTALLKEGERFEPGPGRVEIRSASFGEPEPDPAHRFVIEPAMGEPVRRQEELPALRVSEPRPKRWVFDLGQNMVGWVRLRVEGRPGQRLVVRHAEMLNPDGTLYTSNLRGAVAADVFTLKGGEESLEPWFTFHGFRYVEVTGLESPPAPEMATGIVAHTSMRPTGSFSCSSELVNKLVHNIVWGQKGNYFEVPTDCPQRDERLGWTGDAQFFISTAAYNFDVAAFMRRWLKTLSQDAQFEDGTFAHVAPKVQERGGSTAWGDAAIQCVYESFLAYADDRVIRENYQAMRRYMSWLDGKTTDGIAKVGGFGDWVNLGDPTSQDLIDTAYRAELCGRMAIMSGVVGELGDQQRFANAREEAASAFAKRFVAPDGSLKESGQTGYALAFTMGLIPADLRAKAGEKFAETIAARGGRLATGFIGTPRLLRGLCAAGQPAVAGKLLLNEEYPGWLYQVKLGATTMWERWDGWTPERGFQDVGMNSFNHYAFGAVGEHLFARVAGISPASPGYASITVAPTLLGTGLTHAEAKFDSPRGMVASAWRIQPGAAGAERFVYDIEIPPGATAELWLPLPTGAALGDVREGGLLADQARGVRSLQLAADQTGAPLARLAVGSGAYRFEIGK